MEPTLWNNDHVLAQAGAFQRSPLPRLTIVVLKDPVLPDIESIKRIIGLPGEKVGFQDGKTLINGRPIPEPYLKTGSWSDLIETEEWRIDGNQYFVMGDNRDYSRDSRHYGPINGDLILGRAWFRYWPPERWGRLPVLPRNV